MPTSVADPIDLEVDASHPSSRGVRQRWVLTRDPRYGDLLVVEQLVDSKWHPTGGGWTVESLLHGAKWSPPAKGDVIAIDLGGNWFAGNLQAALGAARFYIEGSLGETDEDLTAQDYIDADTAASELLDATEATGLYTRADAIDGLKLAVKAIAPLLEGDEAYIREMVKTLEGARDDASPVRSRDLDPEDWIDEAVHALMRRWDDEAESLYMIDRQIVGELWEAAKKERQRKYWERVANRAERRHMRATGRA